MKFFQCIILITILNSCNQSEYNDCLWGSWEMVGIKNTRGHVDTLENAPCIKFIEPNIYIDGSGKAKFKMNKDTMLITNDDRIFHPMYYIEYCSNDSLIMVNYIWGTISYHTRCR